MLAPRTCTLLAAAAAMTLLTAAPSVGSTTAPSLGGTTAPSVGGTTAPSAALQSPAENDSSTAVMADDGTVVPLQVTGPPEQRLNLVVLGDGYTEAELAEYRADVDKHLNVLWSIDPFRSYRNYLNVYMIEVVSNESGISCDPDDGNVRRDTALNLQYAATCPADPNARGITFGPGGREALEEYVSVIPGVTPLNRQTLTLANTDTYGGIGGRNATTSGGNSLGPLITPHELGHSLGGLQDEYPYFARGVPGDPYQGGEPGSIHHTLLTVPEMLAQQAKWWRWLGEESESGGVIDRYESGLYSASGVWRPSRHSMMRWLGYYFDQVSRERMTERISGRRDLASLAITATPGDEVGADDVLWVETPHPTYHELDVTWSLNGEQLDTDNSRNLDLEPLDVVAGDLVGVTVQDPTEFVRDPAIRGSTALTATRSWTVGEALPDREVRVAFTESTGSFTATTSTERPVGGEDVVFVETSHPTDRVLDVTWRLDGAVIPNPHNSRNLDLSEQDLAEGTYELAATLTDPTDPTVGDTVTWTVDNVAPEVEADLSDPIARLGPARFLYKNWFTMGLEPADDQPGYVVGEFRLDGDGWHHYYGWPDASEGTPFLFTPRGTTIKELVYGALSPGGMSWASFEERAPGYGEHLVEFRAIDAAGNVSEPESFRVRVIRGAGEPPPDQ